MYSKLVLPSSQRHWQQCLICPQTEIGLSKWVCVRMLQPNYGPSVPPLLFICDYSSSPSSEKRPYMWCGKVPPSLLLLTEEGEGVSTKEIPKVPLQWHRRTLWKLACPLTLQHILTHWKAHQESMESPSLVTYNDFLLLLCVFGRVSEWMSACMFLEWMQREGVASCPDKLFCFLFLFFFSWNGILLPGKINQETSC